MEFDITKIEDLLLEYYKTPAKLAEELKKVDPIDKDFEWPFGDEKIAKLYTSYLESGNVTDLCSYVQKNFSEDRIYKEDIPLEIISMWTKRLTPDVISGWAESKHLFMGSDLTPTEFVLDNPEHPEAYMLEVQNFIEHATPLDMAVVLKVLPDKESLHGCPFEEVWTAIGEQPPMKFKKEEVEEFYKRFGSAIDKTIGPPLSKFLSYIPAPRRVLAIKALAENTDQTLFPLASVEAGNFSLSDIIREAESRTGKAWSRNMRTYKNSFKLLDLSEPIYEKLRKEIYEADTRDERLEILESNSDLLEPAVQEELESYIDSLDNFDKSEVKPEEFFKAVSAKPGDMATLINWLEKYKDYLPFDETDTYQEMIRKMQGAKGITQLKSFSLTEEEVEQIKSAKQISVPPEPKRKFKEIPTGVDPTSPSDSRGFAEEDEVPKGAIGSTTGEAPTGFRYLENDFKKQIIDRNYINYDRPKRVQDRRVGQYLQTPPEKRKEFRYDIYKKEGPDGYKRFLDTLAREGAM